jgi:glycosyltransferase involved in cell wall biosynthesis
MAEEQIIFKKILLVSHITDLSGPTEALEDFLKTRTNVLGVIYHPFHYCSDRRSYGGLFQNGALHYGKKLVGAKIPQVAAFFKDIILTLFFFIRFKKRFDIYIGVDPLNAMVGIVLRSFGLVKSVIFYTIDWMPQRFNNRILNAVYHAVDKFCVRGCDASWNISGRIVEVRKRQGLADSKNILVPVGIEYEKINLPANKKTPPKRLALLGALAPSKGVDLVMEAYHEIRNKCPDIELYVIGRTPINAVEDGVVYQPYEGRLLNLGDSVKLLGVKPHDEVFKILPEFDIGLALYKPYANNLSQWADPSRVKDYLACGLPVIITDVPEIAKDIRKFDAGVVVKYTVKALVDAVSLLYSNAEKFIEMRKNAIKYMEGFRWDKIFLSAFQKMNIPK